MNEVAYRRLVGIDLGVATAHTAQVLDETGQVVAKRRVRSTVESFTRLEMAALEGAGEGTRLEVVIEPTGAAWLPVAVWFTTRGHTVFRVSSQKAADLRRFLSRHAKSNTIDAHTLARLPLLDPDGLRPVDLPTTAAQGSLDRRVRACRRLTRQIARHKMRIRDLARQAIPMVGDALSSRLTKADLAVLERYADPRKLLRTRRDRLERTISVASKGHTDDPAAKAAAFRSAARLATELYGDSPAIAWDDLAQEIATEIRLLRATQAELDDHATARESAYQIVDPQQLARSLPAVADVGGPMLVAVMGNPARFPNAASFKAYVGLVPRASETGNTDRKGQPISKAGNSGLRTQLIRSADTARRLDPQLAAVYYDQMVNKGAAHTKACCVVAAKLAERGWTVLHRGTPYQLRDVDDNPVTPEQAKAISVERYTIPEDIRRRRRSSKTRGRAPQQALDGQVSRRSKRQPRRPSPQPSIPTSTQHVNPNLTPAST